MATHDNDNNDEDDLAVIMIMKVYVAGQTSLNF